jgi:hypothetical protein
MLTGFFCLVACLLPGGQAEILAGPPPYLAVTAGSQTIGYYVDDTFPDEFPTAASLRARTKLPVYAATYGLLTEPVPNGTVNLVEDYPFHNPTDPWGAEKARAYILQAFAWPGGSFPTYAQLRRLWCGALANSPTAVFWYYWTPTVGAELMRVENLRCPGIPPWRLHYKGW